MRLATVLMTLALAFPATAHAWTAPPASPEGRLAYFLPIARAAWPDSPCDGRETVNLHAQIETADYGSYGYGIYDPAAEAFPETCTVNITDRAPADAINWCSELVHEFGHLAYGPDHSEDPKSIMFGGQLSIWGECYTASKPPKLPVTTKNYVRELLPAPVRAWRITCTPATDQHPRCRAERHGHILRFKMLRGDGRVFGVEPT